MALSRRPGAQATYALPLAYSQRATSFRVAAERLARALRHHHAGPHHMHVVELLARAAGEVLDATALPPVALRAEPRVHLDDECGRMLAPGGR